MLNWKFVFGILIAFAVSCSSTSSKKPPQKPPPPVEELPVEPLRIGTIGSDIFHRPFCPHARQLLIDHPEKRINYFTREQIANSGMKPDSYCFADIFDCSDMSPIDFVNSGNDPWCGANISRRNYDMIGIDSIVGKTLCNLQGYIGIFVDDPLHCVDGKIIGSQFTCNFEVCSACVEEDCAEACIDCIRVTLVPLNKITLGLGDANRDGELDSNDSLYFHECYSGASAPATQSCVNVFDWDGDGDVDEDDLARFTGYQSGNPKWVSMNYPLAVINPERSPLPLRAGTEGLPDYHRLDCPSVNASWADLGLEKRIDYYTWKQIEDSDKVPDNVCFAGTRINPSGK